MRRPPKLPPDAKTQALREAGALHPHPDAVRDDAFLSHPFFDPRDRVQVKYEMVRRHRVDGRPVTEVAAALRGQPPDVLPDRGRVRGARGPRVGAQASRARSTRFETALTKLNDGLARPRAHKRLDQVWQRIGRLKAKHSRVASHYQVAVTANEAGDQAGAVTWTRRPQDGSMVTHPGVYCLRSSETDWDEDALWRTYTTLTDVEAVFRSLKSELGLRPIYHRKPARADGHLFITVIAYQLVQILRTRLRAHGEHASWTTLRRILEGQQRVTATFRRPDGRTLHVRTATQAEPDQRAIYDALGVDPHPGGVRKTLV